MYRQLRVDSTPRETEAEEHNSFAASASFAESREREEEAAASSAAGAASSSSAAGDDDCAAAGEFLLRLFLFRDLLLLGLTDVSLEC